MNSNRLIVIGRATKPFGIKGEIRISPYTESFEAFENSAVLVFDETPFNVIDIRSHKGHILAILEGVNTPEQAKLLSGCLVKTDEGNLPPKSDDEYYWHELIGMKVLTIGGRNLGKITNITPTGANDVLHVEGGFGEVLLPMIDDVVISVDVENQIMMVDPLEGLVPDG